MKFETPHATRAIIFTLSYAAHDEDRQSPRIAGATFGRGVTKLAKLIKVSAVESDERTP